MVSASVIVGSAEAGEMVQMRVVALQLGFVVVGMLKLMVSAPGLEMRLLASSMAALKVHTSLIFGLASQMPLRATSAPSDVEVTVKVLAWAGLAPRSTPREAATNKARSHKAIVLALLTHATFGAALRII
jgi:hypothetical protein